MKKLFATLACTALLSVSITTASWAQDQPAQAPEAAATEEVAAPAVADQEETQEAAEAPAEAPAEEASFHQALKTKFIEGGADFMAIIALALILGLALCMERIIYLNLSDTNVDKLLKGIEDALARGDVEGA